MNAEMIMSQAEPAPTPEPPCVTMDNVRERVKSRIKSDDAFSDGQSGDDVTTAEMDFNAGQANRMSMGSPMDYSAGWSDQRQQDTNSGRKNGYMGVENQ